MPDLTPGQLVKHLPSKGLSSTILMLSKMPGTSRPCWSTPKAFAKFRSLSRVRPSPSDLTGGPERSEHRGRRPIFVIGYLMLDTGCWLDKPAQGIGATAQGSRREALWRLAAAYRQFVVGVDW